jgi:hypothetical protein
VFIESVIVGFFANGEKYFGAVLRNSYFGPVIRHLLSQLQFPRSISFINVSLVCSLNDHCLTTLADLSLNRLTIKCQHLLPLKLAPLQSHDKDIRFSVVVSWDIIGLD